MLAFTLCLAAMWRLVISVTLTIAFFGFCERFVEGLMIDVTYRSGVALDQLPKALEAVWQMFLFIELMLFMVTFGAVCNAYRCYRILYPKFVRGGRDAIHFYWWRTTHHGGCPATGFKVAVTLATLQEKR